MNKNKGVLSLGNEEGTDIYIDDTRKIIFISVNKNTKNIKNELTKIDGYAIIVLDSIRSINYIGGEING